MFTNAYQCEKCGCKELAYQRYVRAEMDVEINDGTIEYGITRYDDDDEVGAEYGYVCRKCGKHLMHAGRWLQVEQDLIEYLNTDLQTLEGQQKVYEGLMAEEAELQKDNEELWHYSDVEELDLAV